MNLDMSEKQKDWLDRVRDPDRDGLIATLQPDESGLDHTPKYDAYLAGKDPKSPTASPLYADLKGLPPLLMEVGTAETLLDDSLRFADRARAAGVDVRCVPCEGAIHVYQAYAPHTPEAIASVSRIGAFIAAHTE